MATAAAELRGDASHGSLYTPSAPGSLTSLARKLEHPLVHIRARALSSLLFKLREGLVDIASASHVGVDFLASTLVPCLQVPELEPQALKAIEWMLPSETDALNRITAPALQRHNATAVLQRGTVIHTRPELQAAYEKLLQRLLATPTVEPIFSAAHAAPPVAPPPFTQRSPPAPLPAQSTRQSVRLDPPGDPLSTSGWRPPFVSLATMDDQFLFELEVKWRLRSDVRELVSLCDVFRCEVVRDFPPQVFLQRPAVLQRVLELLRQPIVPAPTDPELSFGANYFDEPSFAKSFVWKPSITATALHVASLKVIEAWLGAMHHGLPLALSPLYHNFDSTLAAMIGSTAGWDHRRLNYPRANGEGEERRGGDSFSLGGAMYLVSATVLRLLASDTYPHLHLLNIAHKTLSFLPERSAGGDNKALNKLRVEALLSIVTEVINRSKNQAIDWFVAARLADYVAGLLSLHEPTAYSVPGESEVNESTGESIKVPASVWQWMLLQCVERGDGAGHLTVLTAIDSTATVAAKRMALAAQDSRALYEALASTPLRAPPSLSIIVRLLHALPTLDPDQRMAARRCVLDAVTRFLSQESGEPSAEDAKQFRRLVLYAVRHAGSHAAPFERELAVPVLDSLTIFADHQRTIAVFTADGGDAIHSLMTALASADTNAEPLWRLAELVLRSLAEDPQSPRSSRSVALLQHFAYADAAQFPAMTEPHRRLQRVFVRLAHEIEGGVSPLERLLLVSRCLLHRSAYIRQAAAAGLYELLLPQSIEEEGEPLTDPFGLYATGERQRGEERRILEDELPTLVYPSPARSESSASTNNTSAILHRVGRLRRVIAAPPVDPTAEGTALQQLLIDLAHASTVDWTLLHEAGEIDEVVAVVAAALAKHHNHQTTSVLLGVLRLVLTRSLAWRQRMRQDPVLLPLLLSFAFSKDPRTRAEAYWVVLALSCALESVVVGQGEKGTPSSPRSPPTLCVPREFLATFGLFGTRWASCGVTIQPLAAAIVDQIESPVEDRGDGGEELAPPSSPGGWLAAIDEQWTAVETAPTFRTYLDAVYRQLHVCYADPLAAKWVATHGLADLLDKYLVAAAPTSAKDDVVLAATLTLVDAVFEYVPRDAQLQLLLALRQRRVLSSLVGGGDAPRHQSPALAAQVARLLLHVGRSGEEDMLSALVADAGVGRRLMDVAVSSSPPLQLTLWTSVVHAAGAKETAALETIAGRHRVPGSFQSRDAYVRAIACLEDASSSSGGGRWRARLVFDSTSTVRAVAFHRLGEGGDEDGGGDSDQRRLRLAVDTVYDETESDAVRGAAAQYIAKTLVQCEPERVEEISATLGSGRFLPQSVRELVARQQARTKYSPRLDGASLELLRMSLGWSEHVASALGGTARSLLLGEIEEDFRHLAVLAELLSLRGAFAMYQRHCFSHVGVLTSEDATWVDTVLPTTLATITEAAKLFQALLDPVPTARITRIIKATPLVVQVADSLVALFASLEQHNSQTQAHYAALDDLAKLLSLLLRGAEAPTLSLPERLLDRLAHAITALLDPSTHPLRFRLSFARLVAAALSRERDGLATRLRAKTHAASIASHVWTAYQQLSDQVPLEPSVRSNGGAILPHLRRTAVVLQTLSAQSPDAAAKLATTAVMSLIRSIKTSLAAIRLARPAEESGGFLPDLLAAIQLHCAVLSGVFASSSQAQDTAHGEHLPLAITSNWTVLRQRRAGGGGGALLVSVLRMLLNYVHRNPSTKASLAASSAQDSLLVMVAEVALSSGGEDLPRRVASAVLRSALVHVECLHGAIKTGVVTKLFARVLRSSHASRQSTKPLPRPDHDALADQLTVLASVACSEEGRAVLLQQRELKNLVEDVLHFSPNSPLLAAGSLLLRNIAYSAKTQFSVWEPALPQLLSVINTSSASEHGVLAAGHLATALLLCVLDNQRAQSLLVASDKTRRLLDDAARRWSSLPSDGGGGADVSSTLQRIQTLLQAPPQP